MSIRPLPSDVVAQIKSSSTITSLNGVIIELVKNSLDAQCQRIDVSVDYVRGGCIIEDDGLGISPFEFDENGGLGKPYHSSKFYDQRQLYGCNGVFLFSLSALALLSITSHHHLYRSYNSIQMSRSRVVSRHTPAPVDHHFPYLKHGTRITVRDLFGNMPVRVKQRAIEAEKHNGNAKSWDELKRGVVGLLLSWPDHVALTIRDVESGQKIVIRPSIANQLPGSLSAREIDMQNIHSILFQARYVNNTERGSWVAVAASTSNLNITGAISLRPSPSRKVQFLSIGIEPLTSFHSQDVLYDEINRLFLESSFGDEEANLRAVDLRQGRRTEEYCEQPKYTKRELRSNRKGVDRWPMFYLKIDVLGNPRNREKPKIDSVLDDGGAAVENILELLRATISEFLSKHHFQSRSFAKEPVLVSVETSADRRAEESCDTFSATYKGLKSKATANEQLSTDNLNISPTKGPFDSLKGNVQLPSLSQGAKSHSPFDAWSRVKSGSPVWKDLVETTESGSARSRTLRVSSAHDREIVPSKPEAGTSNPLICKSGKVLRPPFDNSQLQNELVSLRKPDDNDHTDAQGDEIESWLDPVSKLESMVNRRTGCTISSKEKRTGSGPFSRNKAGVINPSNRPQSTMPYPKRPSSPWINDILNAWENPTFVPSRSQATDDWKRIPNLTTQSVREAGCTKYSDVDIEQAFQQSASAIQGRISKESLLSAEVVAQVDDKFILLKMQPTDPEADLATVARDPILVIVDQHAADERVRIEELMAELCAQRYDKEIGIVRMILDRPLIFEIAPNEVEMLRSQRQHFADWGIQYDIQCGQSVDEEEQDTRLIVRSLPPCVMERYALDPALLINHIRSEVWKKNQERIGSAALGRTRTALSEVEPRHTWVRLIHDCPQGLMDVLNSRSCRSAIMFNDRLSKKECEYLIHRLAECAFPFQCAHGRPSMVPLLGLGQVDIDSIGRECGVSDRDFGESLNKWKDARN